MKKSTHTHDYSTTNSASTTTEMPSVPLSRLKDQQGIPRELARSTTVGDVDAMTSGLDQVERERERVSIII
jgi:hypothetical protein